MSALSTPTYDNREKAQKKKRKNKELTQMTKSQRKAKTRSFEMSKEQSLVPKDTTKNLGFYNKMKVSWKV